MSAFKPSDIARHGRRLLTAVRWLDAYSILMTVASVAIEYYFYFSFFMIPRARPVNPYHLGMPGEICTVAWLALEIVLWLLVVHVDKTSQLYSHLRKPLKSAYQYAAMSAVAALIMTGIYAVCYSLL